MCPLETNITCIYIQKWVYAYKAACQLFCSLLLICFQELNCFHEISVWNPQKILPVCWNSKLQTRLDLSKSKLETWASKLHSWFSKTSKIENWVVSQDCQLTFERYYCRCINTRKWICAKYWSVVAWNAINPMHLRGSERGVLIPHSHSIFMRILHILHFFHHFPESQFFFSEKYI